MVGSGLVTVLVEWWGCDALVLIDQAVDIFERSMISAHPLAVRGVEVIPKVRSTLNSSESAAFIQSSLLRELKSWAVQLMIEFDLPSPQQVPFPGPLPWALEPKSQPSRDSKAPKIEL